MRFGYANVGSCERKDVVLEEDVVMLALAMFLPWHILSPNMMRIYLWSGENDVTCSQF